MKHTAKVASILGTVALGMALAAPAAHALTATAGINAYQTEKGQIGSARANIQADIAAFKGNLAKIKSATATEKRQFAVDIYAKADAFFTTQYNQLVKAMTAAEAQGVDTAEAKVHFDKAWQTLLEANADAKALADLSLDSTTYAQAKTYAKKAESEYVTVRSELRAGAIALKVAIQTKYHVTTPVGSVSGSAAANASASAQ